MRPSAVILTLAIGVTSVGPLQSQDDGRLPPGRDWTLPGGHWGQSRFSTLRQIHTANVKRLGGAWHTRLHGEHVQATPVVRDGLMFVPTGAQNLYALNAATGATVWAYRSGGSGGAGRHWGVALGGGMVFLPQKDTRIIALDQRTGAIIWSHRLADADDGSSVAPSLDSPPTYARGLVISGLQSGDQGVRGRVTALDAKTGHEVWRFYTVPGPGEIGHDTWPADNDAWRRGGGAVWHSPAVDADLGLVYFNTGNAWPSYVGEHRAGDNLFTASIVAVELKTGKYRWHYQITHHDIWDWDAPNPVVLFDANVGGRRRAAIAEIRTDGYLFMLDRATGVPLFPIEERRVKQEPRQRTAATQPYPVGVEPVVPACVPHGLVPRGFTLGCAFDPVWSDQPNLVVPSFGVRHAPFSYSPLTGYFYVVASVLPRWIFRNEATASGGFRLVPGTKSYGVLTAINSRTQRIVWQQKEPYHSSFGSGTMVTAGNLMFHGEPDGHVHAFNARTGESLWRFQTEFGADGPVMTYETNGQQYVALTVGGNVYNFSAGGDAVWAFKLGGTLGPTSAPSPPPTIVPVPGPVIPGTRIDIGAPEEHLFSPTRMRINAGGVVTWTNKGTIAHGVEARDGSWSSGLVSPGDTVSLTFEKPGSYVYVCPTHPWAIAELVVQRAQAADPWLGTWRLDLTRSSFSPGPPPMSQTIEIQSRDGDGLYVVTNGVDARGRPTHTERTARFDGMDYPAQGFDQPTTQAFTRINDRSYEIVSKAGGRIITRTRVTVSLDGTTMTTVTAGDVGQGPLNNTQILENVKR